MIKILYTSFLSLFSVFLSLQGSSLYALSCSDGTTSTTVGMALQINGCYQDSVGRQYSYTTSSPSSSSSAGYAPALGDTTPANSNDNLFDLPVDKIRAGNITLADIPTMIAGAIEFILFFAGTICVVAIIYHAVRMQLASGILGDQTGVDKAKKGIYSAMMGFILSMSAWFIMTKLVAIFGAVS